MFNLAALKLNFPPSAIFCALAIGAIGFSHSAAASPLPLFPFFLMPPAQSVQPPLQAAPSGDEDTAAEMPARLKRQVVSYATREAPGTIVIDTPNTYLYYVLGNGQALRYGIGRSAPAPCISAVRSTASTAQAAGGNAGTDGLRP